MLFVGQGLLTTDNEMYMPLLWVLLLPEVASSVSLGWGLQLVFLQVSGNRTLRTTVSSQH